jgi:hypothetical protein
MQFSLQQQLINDYVHRISKGIVNLSPNHCQTIINMLRQTELECRVEISRYDNNQGQYKQYLTQKIPQERFLSVIEKNKSVKPIEYFYMFRCFDASGEFVDTIYSLNSTLFD